MTLSECYKGDRQAALQRIHAFWKGERMDRPLLHFRVRRKDFAPPSRIPAMERDHSPCWQAAAARNYLNTFTFLCEALPTVSPCYAHNIGFSGEIVGAEYRYEENGHAYIQRRPTVFESPLPVFDPNAECHRNMTAIMQALSDEVDDSVGVTPPVLGVDPYTVLSLLIGAADLIMRMMDEDSAFSVWIEHANRAQMDAYDFYFSRFTARHGGLCSTWFDIVAPGKMEAVQCDFAAMLSPTLFRQHVAPILKQQCGFFAHSLYHLDGVVQRAFLDSLAEIPGLRGIQWNPEPRERAPLKWLDTFQDIRNRGLSLYFNVGIIQTIDDAVTIIRRLGPSGLSISMMFQNESEADQALLKIEEASR